ncbi:MAG: hypothetical protein M1840_006923 [Geoglossum simile]|nr:MAG: hypothetical protein M1840_006923 [Geoglossum simile]
MPPTRVKSKRTAMPSRRAYENSLPRTTARPPTRRTLKQPSQTPEHIDLTSNDTPSLESTQQASKKPLKPHEPLPTKYTLSINVFVDNIRIYSRIMLQTAGSFDYLGFIAVEAQKTADYCAKIGRDVSTRISTAMIVYNKKESGQSDIETLEDWRLFDDVAASCLQDKSKKDVQLSWVITSQLKALSVELEKEALEPFEDENEDNDEDAEGTRSSKQNTTTNRRLAEARAEPHSNNTNQLLGLYKCMVSTCRNSAAYCFPVAGISGGHYALNAHTIRQWVLAIEDSTATIHNPPVLVWNSIINMQKAQKSTPLSPPAASPAVPPPVALPAPPSYYLPYNLPYNPLPYNPPLFGPVGPYGTHAEALNRLRASRFGGSANRPSSSGSIVEPRSSLTDPQTLTRLYIAWYREKFPMQAELLDVAAERIERAAYSLDAIIELSAVDWQRIGVPEGLGWQLSGNVMKFRRQRDLA